jgi:hypothetical protein
VSQGALDFLSSTENFEFQILNFEFQLLQPKV